MAKQLSEQQFNAVLQKVMASAPDGLDEAGFQSLLDNEVAKAETAGKGFWDRGLDDLEAVRDLRSAGMGGMIDGAAGGGVGVGSLVNVAAKPAIGMVQGLARRLYGGLLKPKQGLKDSFGDAKEIAGTLLDERVPISRGGVEKITGRLGQSRDTAMQMVKDAEAAGTQGVIARDVLSEFRPVVSELRKRVDIGQADELGKVGQRGRVILRTTGGRGGDLPLTRAQQLKETAQDASSGAYRAMERGTQKQLSADDLLDTAVARGLKGGIERKVPGVQAQNARTQKLLGGTRALEDAVEREANNNMIGGGRDWAALAAAGLGGAGGGPPGAAVSGLLMRLLATPSTGSRIAIGANELGKRVTPEAALRQALLTIRQEDRK